MNNSLQTYLASREILLAEIIQTLSEDERFVAAWLTGSFGRNDADAVSDLDLSVAVSDTYSEVLCVRSQQVSAQTTKDRLDLFSKFGEPAIIHENNSNAPEGGTFTFVLYSTSAVMVDWILIPHSKAQRPSQSRLLFDKVNLPVSSAPEPESLEQRIQEASDTIAFFWMMTAITAKYLVRRDDVFVVHWLEELHRMAQEVEQLLTGEARHYRRGSRSLLQPTRKGQVKMLRQLCSEILGLMPKVSELGGYIPSSPMLVIETLLNLVTDA
jgi:predicted nucleotidyltransferase